MQLYHRGIPFSFEISPEALKEAAQAEPLLISFNRQVQAELAKKVRPDQPYQTAVATLWVKPFQVSDSDNG